jgi:hypothetical protein
MVKLNNIKWQVNVEADEPKPPADRKKRRRRPDRCPQDAAILMEHLDLRDALEILAHRGRGELEQTRWQRMGAPETTIDALYDGGFIYPCDHEEHDHADYWELSPRGRAALAAVEPEIAKEDRARRQLGPLTIADLWAHDVLVDKGSLSWKEWAAEARPHLLRAQEEAWIESGKAIRHGNYCPPPWDTVFAKSVFKLIKRGFVARRKDGTYASLRPMILKPEADMCE